MPNDPAVGVELADGAADHSFAGIMKPQRPDFSKTVSIVASLEFSVVESGDDLPLVLRHGEMTVQPVINVFLSFVIWIRRKKLRI